MDFNPNPNYPDTIYNIIRRMGNIHKAKISENETSTR